MGRTAIGRRRPPRGGEESGGAASGGWRLPAEWEPHEATWIGWPHNTADWPGRFGPIPWAYAEIARWITRGETLRILVESAEHRDRARRTLSRFGIEAARLEFFRIPTDRGWTRDAGPSFVRREGPTPEVAIRRFRFNGWARYPDWKRDARVPERVGRALGIPVLPAGPLGVAPARRAGPQAARSNRGRTDRLGVAPARRACPQAARSNRGRTDRLRLGDVVLEGGAIDVNGRGTILTTEECLLDSEVQVRNAGFGRGDYERVFADSLGAPNVLWLGRGIAGDDTHGHVDDLARFTNPRTLVLCREEDPSDENHAALEENRERAEGFRLEDGSRPDVVPLPMPSPVVFDGRRLPASYANFYVANAAVLVPTFNDVRDREALGILGELFRDRPVVGIYAGDLVWGLGTIHCLTRQQPAAERSKEQ